MVDSAGPSERADLSLFSGARLTSCGAESGALLRNSRMVVPRPVDTAQRLSDTGA